MKTRKIFQGLAVALAGLWLLNSCSGDENKWSKLPMRFISEEYKPFNYTVDGVAKGLSSDLLTIVCDELMINHTIEFLPWDEGYATTLNNDGCVLFTTALNTTRKDLFKWAGPIASLDWSFYAAMPAALSVNSLEEAKDVGKIGVIEDYAIEQYLFEEGFSNLVYCTDVNDALSKLLNGEIDLFPSDKFTTEAALLSLGKSPYSVNPIYTIKTDLLYFAFNKEIPDDFIESFQQAIDWAKDSGILKELSQKYLSTSHYPDVMQVYTEPYPPLTFRDNNGEVTGYGTDIVKEIMKRNNLWYEINLSSWSNGYQLALNNPNFCLFTMDRTETRENLFKWVGPIGTNTTFLYTLKTSGITISSIDEAKNLSSIGTVDSWFSTQHLQQLGFTNLVYDSNPEVLTAKMMKGEIDAFVCSSVTFPDILKKSGYRYNEVNESYALMSSDYYISFSENTSQEVVNTWQTTLDAIKADGTYEAISKRWFP